MRYCTNCILPDTRPGLELDAEGVCSACRAHGEKLSDVDWVERAERFERLVERVRGRDRPYDCVVPVSGGKDSHWQVVTCLEHGLYPLAVTWKTPGRTEIGERNLANLIELGVDHIDFQVNPRVERKFMLASLVRFGTTAIPMHMAIFNVPVTIAARYDVPLVVWGENSAREYVGADADRDSELLDREWVARYGVVHGTTAADWVSDELSAKELTPYFGPTDEELEQKGIEGVFLGQFFPWDPQMTHDVARRHGFESDIDGARTGVYDFADIDDDFISIHHWLKWHKFGFTRSFDNLSLEIRNGRLNREQAIQMLAERGEETPDGDIEVFCSYVGIDRARFDEIADGYRNEEIWSCRDGTWRIDGFLIPDWDWR